MDLYCIPIVQLFRIETKPGERKYVFRLSFR